VRLLLGLAAARSLGCTRGRGDTNLDASELRCGDGITVADPLATELSEECDDGAATGTDESLCMANCKSGHVEWKPLEGETTLPFPARKLVAIPGYLVISSFDQRGVAVVPIGNTSEPVILQKYSSTSSFEVQPEGILWIERAVPGVGGPWLLWTGFGPSLGSITEIPYPTAPATGGLFALGSNYGPNGFLERDASGHLHRTLVSNLPNPAIEDIDVGPTSGTVISLARRFVASSDRTAFFLEAGATTEVIITDD
jgi:hypothetical protein